MDVKRLESITEEKDLVVIVSEDLKWGNQCSYAVSKANKVLGMISISIYFAQNIDIWQ